MINGPNPKLFFALAAVALVIGAGLNYVQLTAGQEMQNKVDAAKKKLTDEMSIAKDLEASQTRLADLRNKLSHLEQGVPSFAYIPTMLKDLQSFGQAYGIDVEAVRPIPVPPPTVKAGDATKFAPAYQDVPLEIKGRGSYADITRFLAALNKFPKIVGARLINVEPGSSDKAWNKPPLELTMELHAYVFPDIGGQNSVESTRTAMGQVKTNG